MNHIYPDEDLRRWEWCDNSVILANADYYYTKEQTEELIDSVSGLSPSEVQAMINGSIHTKADKEYVDEKVTSLSADMRSNQAQINQRYTKTETINLINQATSGKQDTLIAGENITISGNVISSTAKGDITSGEVESMIAEAVSGKQDTLIAGENITIVDNVISSVGGGVTSGEVETMIAEAVSGKADTSTVEALGGVLTAHTANTTIHITEAERTAWNAKSDFSGDYNDLTNKPTNVSSFNNDAGYLTEHQSLSAYSTTVEMDNAIDAAVSGKQDTLISGTNIKTINSQSILGNGDLVIQGGNDTVELTQAEYDALAVKDPDVFYIITDAPSIDITDYQPLLVVGSGISIDSSNVISCTVQEKTYTAGRSIDISSSDVISLTLPISAGTGSHSIVEGSNSPSNATNSNAHCEGDSTQAGYDAHSEGYGTRATGFYSHSEGNSTTASSECSHSEGRSTTATNNCEHASGQYNVSNKANSTWGNSGNTLFSVGNGTSTSARHNAFEIRQNGDIYCSNGTNDVKLQDYIQFKILKLTQAEYDDLEQGGNIDQSTIYFIIEE